MIKWIRHRDGTKFEKSFKIEKFQIFFVLRHEVPFRANNNRKAVVVCARHVMKRPSKRTRYIGNKFSLGLYVKPYPCSKTIISCFNTIIPSPILLACILIKFLKKHETNNEETSK